MDHLEFIKMHGLGNDFVITDGRQRPVVLAPSLLQKIADRKRGVGFDQFIVLENTDKADVFMRIYNADGSESGACGNATRCVARLVMDATQQEKLDIETGYGILKATKTGDNMYAVDMGKALEDWKKIPLSHQMDTLHIPMISGPLSDGVGVNIGNPHVVFFVDDINDVDMDAHAKPLETHEWLPEKANIGVVEVKAKNRIRYRVWERGVGVTEACGSGACAAGVAAMRRGLTNRKVLVELDGGSLGIEWLENGHVIMTGPTTLAYAGALNIKEMMD